MFFEHLYGVLSQKSQFIKEKGKKSQQKKTKKKQVETHFLLKPPTFPADAASPQHQLQLKHSACNCNWCAAVCARVEF